MSSNPIVPTNSKDCTYSSIYSLRLDHSEPASEIQENNGHVATLDNGESVSNTSVQNGYMEGFEDMEVRNILFCLIVSIPVTVTTTPLKLSELVRKKRIPLIRVVSMLTNE